MKNYYLEINKTNLSTFTFNAHFAPLAKEAAIKTYEGAHSFYFEADSAAALRCIREKASFYNTGAAYVSQECFDMEITRRTEIAADRSEVETALGEYRFRQMECEYNQFFALLNEGEENQTADFAKVRFIASAADIARIAEEYHAAGVRNFEISAF